MRRPCGAPMPINPQKAISDLEQLRALTADDHGAQRIAWTPTWLKARAWFQKKLAELPVEHHLDAAGNSWTTLPGDSKRVLILGSHLDSVPNGGWLDGALGVLASFEVLRSLAEDFKGKPPVTIRLVDWADEEGARFGRSLFGSSAFAGTQTIQADRGRTDRDGIRLEDALKHCQVDVDSIGKAGTERADAGAYLELHIEQGPVLEGMQLPLGVVLGTKGVERHAITFHGQEAHSGSTPMAVRRDALAAAARLALEIRPIARRHPDAVATMGSVKTFPGIVTAVVGRAETTLDMRDLDAGVLASMLKEAQDASERFAAEEGCTVEWSRIWNIEPIPFHPQLVELCDQAIRETSGTSHRLPSGPLHDAAEVARAGIPTVMMFTQSLNGLSHNQAEDTRKEHLGLAVEAFNRLARKTMTWLDSGSGRDSQGA
jgi:N-carbamoyl-L-amino-acid hydrolase